MTKSLKTKIRDWLRGFTDADIVAYERRMYTARNAKPGDIIKLTDTDYKVMLALKKQVRKNA